MGKTQTSSFAEAEEVTPSDDTPVAFEALWVGGVGNVHVVTSQGDDVTFTAVPAGTLLPVQVRLVYEDSTATLIVGLNYGRN